MKHPIKPKFSLSSLILTVFITAGIIVFVSVTVSKSGGGWTPRPSVPPATNPKEINNGPKENPPLLDTTVKHPAYHFKNQKINLIMRKICTWYKFSYGATKRFKFFDYIFTGKIPENASLNETLDILGKLTGIRFEIFDNLILMSEK